MLVSILIPAHNAAPWLGQTLQSALAQTWPHTEIIVVDDGSTDDTASVGERFSPQVRVVRQQQSGAAAARNRALAMAQGDYIQWLDADDLLAPDKIARQMGAVERLSSPLTLLSSPWASFYYCPDRAISAPSALWQDHTPVEWLILKMRDLLHMQPATWLVSRALADAAGPWDETLTLDDDGEYAARLVAHSSGVHFVPDAWVYYRSRGHSLSTIDGTPAKLQSLYRAMCLQIQTLMALEDSERTREACAAYLIGWSPNFRRSSLAGDLVRAVRKFGATFQPPEVRAKYRWLRRIGGDDLAWMAQEVAPRFATCVRRGIDYLLCRTHRQHRAVPIGGH